MSYMDYRKHISKSRLSMEEKAGLRAEFLSRTGLKSSPSHYFINKAPHYVGIAALSLLLVAVGASPFAIAAENAEPGDFLYPVKTTVNEPVKKVVRAVTGKKVAEPASMLADDKEKRDSDKQDRPRDDEERPKEKRTGTQKANPAFVPGVAPVIPAAASTTKKAAKDLSKVIDSVTNTIPAKGIVPSSDTQDNSDDQDVQDTGKDESRKSTVENVTDTADDAVQKTADTVSDTVNKATQGLNLSI